jgi:deazaflavin-dependent oxidoreductase (nitroreductase family)
MDPAGLLAAVDGRKADAVVHALTALKKAPVRHRPAGRRGGILEGGSKLPVSRRVARFNRRFLNPVFLRLAGHLPGFGIVSHVGRKSGRAYRTPVNAFRTDDGYIIALTYGLESDWVKNVLAAGSCELRTRGRRVRLSKPRIETDEDKGWAPLPVGFVLNRIDAPEYMRLWW